MKTLEPDDKFESPLAALLKTGGPEWPHWNENEDDWVPVTAEEARTGLLEAMRVAREKGWIPAEDPGCQCLVCRQFRGYVGEA